MATTTSKTHCVTCETKKDAYKCDGCSQYFCLEHLSDHQQAFSKELDEIKHKSDLFRETLIEHKKNPQKHSLMQQINQWEEESIHKIQQTANEAREVLLERTGESIDEIESKLTSFTEKLKQIREKNDFNEIDLNRFKRKLEQLQEQLRQPSNILIQRFFTLYITKLSVSTTPGKSLASKKIFHVASRSVRLFLKYSFPCSEKPSVQTTESDDENDLYEPKIVFKPLVQLSAVEVKTGDEDEDILFCERGKLYRFDSEVNQMEERGIGEMKILQHKTTKHCRILMHREQILKICANHRITSQMQLKPHQCTASAYVWSAMDFADGEGRHETLCIRFKSDDIAKRFAKQFHDAREQKSIQ